ncbi:MAG: hypothetical protein HY738_10445 [Bacteroidia bacterium]|nr:hypothetical protein [Bacteroidia bacterium]
MYICIMSQFVKYSLKSTRLIIILIILIHFIYFIIALLTRQVYNLDSYEYLQQAKNIVQHGSFYSYYWDADFNSDYYSLRPPVYGLFIMMIKFFWDNDFLVLFFQNIISIFTFIGVLQLIKIFHGSTVRESHCNARLTTSLSSRSYWLVIVSLILFPVQLIVTNSIWSEVIFQALIFWSFYFLFLYFHKKKLKYLVFYNLLLTASLFTKPVMIYFWIPNLFISFLIFFENRKVIVLLLPLILPFFAFLWSLCNWSVTNYFHFSSIRKYYLTEYAIEQILIVKEGEKYAENFINDLYKKAEQQTDYGKQTEYILKECSKIIKENFWLYSYLHLRGCLNFLIDPGEGIWSNFLISGRKKKSGF